MGTRRFGVVGAGRHGSRYIRHILNDVKGAKLEAICRHDTGKDMGIEGIGPEVPVHGDLKKFLKEDLQIHLREKSSNILPYIIDIEGM